MEKKRRRAKELPRALPHRDYQTQETRRRGRRRAKRKSVPFLTTASSFAQLAKKSSSSSVLEDDAAAEDIFFFPNMSVNFVAVFVADIAEETRFCGATTWEFALPLARCWWVFVTSVSGIVVCLYVYVYARVFVWIERETIKVC